VGPDPNPTMRWGIFRKLTLTIFLTLTAINFVHVNDIYIYRFIYDVNWRMVVLVGGNCPTPCKKGGELFGRRKCPVHYVGGGNVQGGMSGSPWSCLSVGIRRPTYPDAYIVFRKKHPLCFLA